ncbi:hypothetical protein LZ198_08405 [Myxococcus sp. K15C18031901]|uniref:hypothetical protein n=1 Tax=Myxococcus dinghuensis TaxID=2906761 RepID=UPI0020A83062|nr:hypothetical protein [Myxococcus dinghuensis]MCP3098895.1 hypothetical protein [Myxococcus dinghuensis]
MWLRSLSASLVILLLSLAPTRSADACGPDFPASRVSERVGTLAEMPDGSFFLEATRLVPKPADTFVVAEGLEPEGARTGGGERETALYAAGAKAFERGDAMQARARFLELLSLPAEQRRRFSTFAAYMLGRNAGAGLEQDAPDGFSRTRELARQGFDDPLGLAVASLGEEARLLLAKGDDLGAIRLYAEQAAHGSTSGQVSLLIVARALARDEARLRAVLVDPLGQRLMTTFLWTRGQEWYWHESPAEGGAARALELLATWDTLAGADRLAAAAWRAGRFDLAERFAQQEQTPLSAWVKAKLALRKGDRASAEVLLAQAAKGLPEAEDWRIDASREPLRPLGRVEAERGLLALVRADYAGAAEHMLASCSWPDLAYVAERVLTASELTTFIAAHPPAEKDRCEPELRWMRYGNEVVRDDGTPDEEAQVAWEEERNIKVVGMNPRLRLLLARRLLRDGQEAQSLEYFRGTAWEEEARLYVGSLEQSRRAEDPVDKARALYTASRVARRHGMELLGTEVAPDWAWLSGFYDFSDYEAWGSDEERLREELSPGAFAAREAVGSPPLLAVAEQRRVAGHAPPHAMRYHYRATAADLAQRGAALLPPRSHAYAMMLCHAARYIWNTDPDHGQRLYQLYVRTGAAIADEPWSFGHECPEPNFDRVQEQLRAQRSWRGLPMHVRIAWVGSGLLLPGLAAILLYRKRKSARG